MTFQIRGNPLRERGLAGFGPGRLQTRLLSAGHPSCPTNSSWPHSAQKAERSGQRSRSPAVKHGASTARNVTDTLGVPESEELCRGDWCGLPRPAFLQTRAVFPA